MGKAHKISPTVEMTGNLSFDCHSSKRLSFRTTIVIPNSVRNLNGENT